MPHHEESIVIDAPVEAVFAAMTDLERWRSWWPQIESVRLPDGWTVDGELACRVMGMDLEGAVTAYEPDRELGFETNLPVGGRVTQHFTFQPENGGTRLTVKLDASGMAGMMFTRKRLVRELDRLKANVENAETD
ncbi:MAG: SRPBCC family protein [Chloroflexi bacterium]|nr:SRPBCC family protein [Chloroflexota bacterium]MCH8818632.1 SRPBCC family protein [Chloroflexota bacterium]